MLNLLSHIVAFIFGFFVCAILSANGDDSTPPPQAFA
jgi:hypothetical protein